MPIRIFRITTDKTHVGEIQLSAAISGFMGVIPTIKDVTEEYALLKSNSAGVRNEAKVTEASKKEVYGEILPEKDKGEQREERVRPPVPENPQSKDTRVQRPERC